MSKYNLFFVGTPLNYISSEKIVEYFEKDSINILFSTRPQNEKIIRNEVWDSVYEVYPPKYQKVKKGFFKKLNVYKENLKKVVESCRNADEINLHISIMNNHEINFFINGIRKNYGNKKFNVRIIPEGLQNVARYPLTYGKMCRQYIKKTWKFICPELDYYLFSGDVTGADDKIVDRIYLLPNLPHEYDKNKIIYIPSITNIDIKHTDLSETAIVLGQPLVKTRVMKHEDSVKVAEEIYKFLKQNGFSKILYKPHQREPIHEYSHEGYDVLSINEAIETHFLSHNYGMVVGVSSTALLTARMILPETSRIVSYGMNKSKFIDDAHREKLYAPFKKLNIEIYDTL